MSLKRGASLAQAMDVDFFEVSAKTGVNLQETYTMVIEQVMKHAVERLGRLIQQEEEKEDDPQPGCFFCIGNHRR